MTRQEIFDKVVKHLLKQGEKSATIREDEGTRCLYRGPNGLMCAVGCLIPDEEYTDFMEDCPVGGLPSYCTVGSFVYELVGEHRTLLQDLQHIHDNYEVENWRHLLREYANDHCLEFNS